MLQQIFIVLTKYYKIIIIIMWILNGIGWLLNGCWAMFELMGFWLVDAYFGANLAKQLPFSTGIHRKVTWLPFSRKRFLTVLWLWKMRKFSVSRQKFHRKRKFMSRQTVTVCHSSQSAIPHRRKASSPVRFDSSPKLISCNLNSSISLFWHWQDTHTQLYFA